MRDTVHLTDPLADAHAESARLVTDMTSIVRAQNRRITDSGTAPGRPEHEAMTDAELDGALTVIEKHFIDRMHTHRTDPANRGEYADNMRAALTRLADAITRADTVHQPSARALAVCDTERATSAVAMLTLYPETAGLLAALDDAEGAAAVAIFPPLPADTGQYLKAVNTAAAVADAADTRHDVARVNPIAYTAFLTVLPHYLTHRSLIASGAAADRIDATADLMTMLAVRLDRARADMAAAVARHYRSSAPHWRGRVVSSSV